MSCQPFAPVSFIQVMPVYASSFMLSAFTLPFAVVVQLLWGVLFKSVYLYVTWRSNPGSCNTRIFSISSSVYVTRSIGSGFLLFL